MSVCQHISDLWCQKEKALSPCMPKSPQLLPSDIVSYSITDNVCPLCLHLVWLLQYYIDTPTSWKETSSTDSTGLTNFDFWSVTLTLTLYNNPIFSKDVLIYDDVQFNWAWLQEDKQFSRLSRNRHILNIWAFTVTLTLLTAKWQFCTMLQLMIMHCHTNSVHVANQSFCLTLWLIMVNHYTNFAFRKYHPDKHSVQFWTFAKNSSPVFSQDIPAYDDVPSN